MHKSFGSQTLFEGANLQINEGDRYALVGPNGAGKSTLFRMLLGEIEPDEGELQLKRGTVTGYLPQENAPLHEHTVLEEALAHHSDPDGRLTAKAKAILMGLGFKVTDFDRAVNELSGGWAMRAAMARLLVQEPDLLMLDEPTNHLDLDSLLWLQDYLQGYRGAIFMISHDRAFVNSVCSVIVSVQEQSLKPYHGNYEHFLSERQAERERLESQFKQQQNDIAAMEEFIMRNKARMSTASRAQSMQKRLDKLERVVLPEDNKTLKIRFPQPSRTGARVLTLKNVHKSYGDLKVYNGLDFELMRGQKMAFVGHNGAGKSTLLKMLAGIEPFQAGERTLGMNVKVGYFSQHRAGQLDPKKTVLQESMDNDRANPELMVRTVLGTFLFPGDSVFKKTEVLSGGEKSRLSLVKFLLDPPNVLLMDEPTTHLDMSSVEALIEALKAFEGTICCISHDLYFMNSLADHVVHVDHGKVTLYPGNFEYFQHRQDQHAKENGLPSPVHGRGAGGESAVKVPQPKGVNPKDERRRRAAEQDRQRALRKTEVALIETQAKLDTLVGHMSDPHIHSDYPKVKAIGDEIALLQAKVPELEKELERLKAAAPEA